MCLSSNGWNISKQYLPITNDSRGYEGHYSVVLRNINWNNVSSIISTLIQDSDIDLLSFTFSSDYCSFVLVYYVWCV